MKNRAANLPIPANKEIGDDIFEDFRPKTQWEIQDEETELYDPYEFEDEY